MKMQGCQAPDHANVCEPFTVHPSVNSLLLPPSPFSSPLKYVDDEDDGNFLKGAPRPILGDAADKAADLEIGKLVPLAADNWAAGNRGSCGAGAVRRRVRGAALSNHLAVIIKASVAGTR